MECNVENFRSNTRRYSPHAALAVVGLKTHVTLAGTATAG